MAELNQYPKRCPKCGVAIELTDPPPDHRDGSSDAINAESGSMSKTIRRPLASWPISRVMTRHRCQCGTELIVSVIDPRP